MGAQFRMAPHQDELLHSCGGVGHHAGRKLLLCGIRTVRLARRERKAIDDEPERTGVVEGSQLRTVQSLERRFQGRASSGWFLDRRTGFAASGARSPLQPHHGAFLKTLNGIVSFAAGRGFILAQASHWVPCISRAGASSSKVDERTAVSC